MDKNLYLIRHCKRKILFKNVKESELHNLIQIYLDSHGIKDYIIRHWEIDNGRMIDFGSHTDFLFWGE